MHQQAPSNPNVPGTFRFIVLYSAIMCIVSVELLILFLAPSSPPPLLPTTHQASRGKVVAEKLIKAHAIVNKFLSSFIDHSLADHGYHVLDPATGITRTRPK
jgi:hypothetical protein